MERVFGQPSSITEYLMRKDSTLIEQDEPTNPDYKCFNTGGVETAVGEFLYGFLRMIRPEYVFETGTHMGVSSSYMGKALMDNNKGLLTTLEIENQHIEKATKRLEAVGVKSRVIIDKAYSLKYDLEYDCDFMFLDSEPEYRFKELERFYTRLSYGGYVFIHDAPRTLCQGNVNPDHPAIKSWPFGDLPEYIVSWVKDRDLVPFHFGTPRGLVGFYKVHSDDYKWL